MTSPLNRKLGLPNIGMRGESLKCTYIVKRASKNSTAELHVSHLLDISQVGKPIFPAES